MSRLLVCSEPDLPSVNMKEALLSFHGWEDMGDDGVNSYICHGDTVMVTIPDIHVRHEDLDKEVERFGVKIDEIIVMSKHSAKSGRPALTAHPIGNYHDNLYGGRANAVVRPAPALMTDALRRIVASNDMPDTQTCFEVTHHGPWMEKPTFFIEVGSEQTHWENKHAAEILAHVIEDLDPHDEYPVAVGMGGGHYAPRFTEVALKYKVNFGHMLPNYQMEDSDDEDIVRMLRLACEATGTKLVYLHRKSMKKPEERRISGLIESAGYEQISSSDLEPLNGNRRRSRRSPFREWRS
jgi:D-aminoacyl-tRNA deacylase